MTTGVGNNAVSESAAVAVDDSVVAKKSNGDVHSLGSDLKYK